MDLKKAVVLWGVAIIVLGTTQIVFAEDAPSIDQTMITSSQQPDLVKETDMQWAWGEVTNLDSQANTVTLKFLDYETDQEKELVLAVDEKTTFENIKDFSELKLKDTLSIDYTVEADNKNIAKNISFEKPDVSSADLPKTTVSDLAQPIVKSEIPVDTSATDEAFTAVDLAPAAQSQVQ